MQEVVVGRASRPALWCDEAVGVLRPLLVVLGGRPPLPPAASRASWELRGWLEWKGDRDSACAETTAGMELQAPPGLYSKQML